MSQPALFHCANVFSKPSEVSVSNAIGLLDVCVSKGMLSAVRGTPLFSQLNMLRTANPLGSVVPLLEHTMFPLVSTVIVGLLWVGGLVVVVKLKTAEVEVLPSETITFHE